MRNPCNWYYAKFHTEGLGELPPEDSARGELEVVVGNTVASPSMRSLLKYIDEEDDIAIALVLMLVKVIDVFVMELPSLILLPGSVMGALGLVPVPKLNAGTVTAPVA